MNFYEYLKERMDRFAEELLKFFEEGEANLKEWDYACKILLEIDDKLDYLKKLK